ncbi:sodium-dependent transporter [Helicobacter canis]|uniref:Transporter n=1 Tax=Helicobacter canis NCTC 12740 TaxID=1357399 RepID=V8CHH7_9HELI|nr:sodium-dependent transporter [Helicobacter canis]ETD26868.1 hypothetical protein HMPREF2087_01262 [Helicobacter canis NCTC 12740]
MGNFSKFGFIMATLGSSIGLGHIWRFPYMAGQMGGGAFVLLFLVMTLFIGVAMLVGEMLMGNKTQKNTADAFVQLDPNPKKPWRFAGLTLIGGPIILAFYAVVLGWVVYYLVGVSIDLPDNAQQADQIYGALLTSHSLYQILGFTSVLGLTGLIVSLGIKDGIEKLNLVLMPLLFIIFIGLLIYAAFQPSFMQAVHFLFDFKYEDISFNVIVAAMGQMCFSLSLGIGIIITYAASTDPKQNLLESALYVVVCGIVISLIAGVMIFTFVYEYEVEVTYGTGLVFKALPIAFSKMGISGVVVAMLFFVGLAFAGVTSTISLLEPSVMYFVQKYNKNRKAVTWAIVGAIYAVGLVLIFSLNSDYSQTLSLAGKQLFVWFDSASSNVIMPLGALISMIFVGYVIGRDRVKEMAQGFLGERGFVVWFFIIRYIVPLVIITAWIGTIISE